MHSPWVQRALCPPQAQPQFLYVLVRCAWCLFWGADLWLRPSWQMSTIQKPLVRNWKPVCSLVGNAISGAKFAPFPCPLPPASGRGWAGPQPTCSSLELLSPSFVPKQCCLLLSVQPPLAGGGCERLGYFPEGSCF